MKSLRALLTVIVAGLLLGGCLGGSGNQTFADGFYRFVHVSPGTDAVVVAANGTSIVPSLAYHAASPYIALGWGVPSIKVQSVANGTTYAESQVPVAAGGHYSYFLYGGGTATGQLSLRDDIGDAATGYFNLRTINLATGIGAIDVYLLPAGQDVSGSTASFTGLAYGTGNVFTQFPIGSFRVVLTPTTTTEIIYDSGVRTFAQNAKLSLLVFSTASGKLVNAALLQNDTTGTTTFVDNPAARFKFVGAATDLQPLDVLVDGALALTGVPYGGVAAYGPVATGSRTFQIQGTNAPGAYVYGQSLNMAAGTDNSLVAYSIAGTGNVGVLAMPDNNLPPLSGKIKLRIVNASSDTTAYDAYANTTKLVSALAQGTASTYQVLDAGTYALGFNPAGTGTAAAAVNATLEAGKVYTIYAYGRSGSALAVLTNDY